MWQVSALDSQQALRSRVVLPLYGHGSPASSHSAAVNPTQHYEHDCPQLKESQAVKLLQRLGLASQALKMFQAGSTIPRYELDSALSSLCKQFRRK